MKILCVFGEHNYGDPQRGRGYEYSNFLPALERLADEIVFFDSFSRIIYKDFADLNRRFLETVVCEKPDVIFCVLMGYELWMETIDLVRANCNTVLINWSTDDSWKYEQFSRLVAPHFHIYATTYPDAFVKSLADGISNFILTQWAANREDFMKPLPARQCRFQVSFVGSAYGNRTKWISKLKEHGIDVVCFGHGWENGPVKSSEIPRIMRESVISLNFGDSAFVFKGLFSWKSRQIKARIFEVPGAGGFLMTEHADNLYKFYVPDREIVIFDGIESLVNKIRYYLANPDERDTIAMNGHIRTLKEHTYENRFQELLKMAEKFGETSFRGETNNSCERWEIDFNEFEKFRRKHRPNLLLKIIGKIFLVPCVAIWGTQRGPRAARRLLFEICWRFFGERTYKAEGLPGRLFYHVS